MGALMAETDTTSMSAGLAFKMGGRDAESDIGFHSVGLWSGNPF
jgi:hypothetical protein